MYGWECVAWRCHKVPSPVVRPLAIAAMLADSYKLVHGALTKPYHMSIAAQAGIAILQTVV